MISYLLIIFMGFTLGLLGGGGSILTVPILVYFFNLGAVKATAYSLFIVGFTASVGAFRNFKNKNVDIKTGLMFALPGFVGVFCSRAFIIPQLPQTILKISNYSLSKDSFIMIVFAIMMLMASYSMIFGRKEKKAKMNLSIFSLILIGFSVGLITGFVGAGGGFIIIPALITFAGLDMKKAVGTSLFIISINSIIGFSGDLFTTNIDWTFLIRLTAFSILGIFIGVGLSSKVPSALLKKVFGGFILLLGTIILYQQF